MAESNGDERALIIERTPAGLAAARARSSQRWTTTGSRDARSQTPGPRARTV